MNCDTGHLVTRAMLDMMEVKARAAYTPVPEHLSLAAHRTLAGRQETYVSPSSGGKLSKFAAANRKQRRKVAKQSRKQNRG